VIERSRPADHLGFLYNLAGELAFIANMPLQYRAWVINDPKINRSRRELNIEWGCIEIERMTADPSVSVVLDRELRLAVLAFNEHFNRVIDDPIHGDDDAGERLFASPAWACVRAHAAGLLPFIHDAADLARIDEERRSQEE
jgi:hypothetical protein